jgi:ABC-2 type transport system permease protein
VRTILQAFGREVRRIGKDAGALLVLIGAIFLYALFYPLPYSRETLRDLPVAAADLDGTAASRRLLRMIDAHDLLRAESVADADAAAALVRSGDAAASLVVPHGFERSLHRGEAVELPVFVDTGYFLAYRQALTGLSEVAGTCSAGVELARSGKSFVTRSGMRDPVRVSFRSLFNTTESYRQYVVPAVLVLILQQTLLVGIGMLHAGGSAPGARTLLGRSLVYLLLYGVHAILYFAVVFPLYGFAMRGSASALTLAVAAFLPATTFLGFALARLLSSREAAIPAILLTSLPAIFLAGFAWPPESMPQWTRWIAQLLPSTHAIAAMHRVTAMGAPTDAILDPVLRLAALAVVYFAIAAWGRGVENGREA